MQNNVVFQLFDSQNKGSYFKRTANSSEKNKDLMFGSILDKSFSKKTEQQEFLGKTHDKRRNDLRWSSHTKQLQNIETNDKVETREESEPEKDQVDSYQQLVQFLSDFLENMKGLNNNLAEEEIKQLEEFKIQLSDLLSNQPDNQSVFNETSSKITNTINNLMEELLNNQILPANTYAEFAELLSQVKDLNLPKLNNHQVGTDEQTHHDVVQEQEGLSVDGISGKFDQEELFNHEENDNRSEILQEGSQNKEKKSPEFQKETKITKEFVQTNTLGNNDRRSNSIYQEIIIDESQMNDLKLDNSNSLDTKNSLPIQKDLFNTILNQVVEKADIHIRENDSEMHLQLKPDNLGRLSMKIAVEKGIVIAKIIAENQVVKEVLESNFNVLKDSLNEKGFGIQEFSVSVGQESLKERNNFMNFRKQKNIKIESQLMNAGSSSVSIHQFQSSGKIFGSSIDFFA